MLFKEQAFDVAFAEQFGVPDQFFAIVGSYLPVHESILVFVELTQDSAQLQVTFAKVSQFEKFGGNVEFPGCIIQGTCHGLSRLPHLTDESFIFIEISDLALQVEDGAVQVARTVFKKGRSEVNSKVYL